MTKVRDTVIAGLLAGWAGNIAKEIMVWTFYFLGWTKYVSPMYRIYYSAIATAPVSNNRHHNRLDDCGCIQCNPAADSSFWN